MTPSPDNLLQEDDPQDGRRSDPTSLREAPE